MKASEVWAELTQAGHGAEGYSTRRLPGARDIRLAIRYPGAERVLLLGFPATVVADPIEVPDSEGFTVAIAALPGEPGRMQVEVALRSQQFAELFGGLAEDLIEKMSPATDDAHALAALVNRLQQWQRFLARLRPNGLTREEQIGLYGELWTLREVVIPALDPVTALHSWDGPSGGNQDFRLSTSAIEVKTSTALEPQSIRITNERQLDLAGLADLFLLQITLNRSPGGDEGLQQIVESIRLIALSVGLADAFDEKLSRVGFLDHQLPDYEESSYTVLRTRAYRVVEGFPRLVESMLPPGLGDVHYSISTAACAPYAMELEAVSTALRRSRPT